MQKKHKRMVLSLPALLFLGFPAFSYANSLSGLGSIAFGIVLGIPSAVLLILFIVASSILLNSQTISEQFRHVYKITGMILSLLGIFIYPIASLLGEPRGIFLTLIFWIPLLILGIVSLFLLFKL